ncbi:hypothetical protein HDV00_002630 [Rhizophlyctis rosea]|nr:hypothetical protein HDV00_002630 [Rhizophlyctis rosea]
MDLTSSSPPIKFNLKPLNGLRGLSAFIVVLGHITQFWVPTFAEIAAGTQPRYVVKIENLSAVSLFFVISGFTLVAVYDKDTPDGKPPLVDWAARKSFFIKRVARLAPIYYLALLIGIGPFVVYGFIEFVIGMSSAFLAKKVQISRPVWGVEITSILLLLSIVVNAVIPFKDYNFLIQFVLPPLHGFWLICLSQSDSGATAWVLNTKAAAFLGDISYSLYCLHWPLHNWIAWAVAGDLQGVPVDYAGGYEATILQAYLTPRLRSTQSL